MAISHDIELMAQYCDRLTLLHQGKVLASGTAHEVIESNLIKQAYDCDVKVGRSPDDTPQIMPIL
jgi:iron complex transport system ATP-binding protein